MNVLMVVNNPGSNDVRVVREAELIVKQGMKCTVLGIIKPGFKESEIINGVLYVRVKMSYNFLGFVLGYFPVFVNYVKLNKNFSIKSEKVEVFTAKKRLSFFGKIRKSPMFFASIVRKLFVKVVFNKRFLQHIAIKFRQGSYIQVLYPYIDASNADILHAHELSVLEVCALAKRNRALVYDSHELELHRNVPWTDAAKRVMGEKERAYIYEANVIIAVSNGCAAELRNEYNLPQVHVVRNTPMLSMQEESEASVRRTIGVGDNVPLIVYTGSVTINRGVELIVEALKYLEGYHLACVGPRNKEVERQLVKLADECKVKARFHLVDPVPPGQVVSFIKTADAAVIPIQNVCLSYYYCLPNKLFEAMHAGLPVVVSDFPDMKEVVEVERIGTVNEMDSALDLAESIEAICTEKEYATTDEKTAYLQGKYCFEQDFLKIIPMYSDLVNKK